MKPVNLHLLLTTSILFSFCSGAVQQDVATTTAKNSSAIVKRINPDTIKTIHVFVALCDNKYQGIVPVGKAIGNGQDADNNLYWGCGYGIRTYFKNSGEWTLLQSRKDTGLLLERILFKHKTANVYFLADAYDGRFIQQTTTDFLEAAAGDKPNVITYKGNSICFGGASNLLAYIGHDGLMDFSLPLREASTDTVQREAIILACYSKNYFSPHLKQTKARPLLWTTGLMAPEAYTLHDAIAAWIKKEPAAKIQEAAAKAYANYQKCSVKAAKNLLATGW